MRKILVVLSLIVAGMPLVMAQTVNNPSLWLTRVLDSEQQRSSRLLFEAARTGDLQSIKSAVDGRADVVVFNKDRKYGATALHWAAGAGHADVVAFLLEHSAPVDARANNGTTPLHWAVALGRQDIVALLIKNHADVNAVTGDGMTPLSLAKALGHRQIAEMLQQAAK